MHLVQTCIHALHACMQQRLHFAHTYIVHAHTYITWRAYTPLHCMHPLHACANSHYVWRAHTHITSYRIAFVHNFIHCIHTCKHTYYMHWMQPLHYIHLIRWRTYMHYIYYTQCMTYGRTYLHYVTPHIIITQEDKPLFHISPYYACNMCMHCMISLPYMNLRYINHVYKRRFRIYSTHVYKYANNRTQICI